MGCLLLQVRVEWWDLLLCSNSMHKSEEKRHFSHLYNSEHCANWDRMGKETEPAELMVGLGDRRGPF